MISDFLKRVRTFIAEAVSSFLRNNDPTAASSLAFSATLALIPTLFLLTFLVSAIIGSSEQALTKTHELLTLVIPAYSIDILREVRSITEHLGTIGLLNGFILIWSVTPLVADMRTSLGTIFRRNLDRPFLLEKLFDVAISIIFLAGLAAIATAGVVYAVLEEKSLPSMSFGSFLGFAPFFFITLVVFLLYLVFSSKARARDLVLGALVTSLLWFVMRPAFHLFLTYNPGYGFAFGSFKSIFVVIIWIYYSLAVFLFGAEVAASLGRGEAVFLRKLMEGRKNVPVGILSKYVAHHEKGSTIYSEGDPGNVMFSVLAGSVALHRGGQEIGRVQAGKCFGGLSFLLAAPRSSTAIALEDTELVAIDTENIGALMHEYPDFVITTMRDMALRLRETNRTKD